MRFAGVVGRRKAGTCVLHDNFTAGIRLTSTNENIKRRVFRIHAVLDGIFHNRLKCQRRQVKIFMRRIVLNTKAVLFERRVSVQMRRHARQYYGRQADIVVLDSDTTACAPEHINDAKVLRTMIGGE